MHTAPTMDPITAPAIAPALRPVLAPEAASAAALGGADEGVADGLALGNTETTLVGLTVLDAPENPRDCRSVENEPSSMLELRAATCVVALVVGVRTVYFTYTPLACRARGLSCCCTSSLPCRQSSGEVCQLLLAWTLISTSIPTLIPTSTRCTAGRRAAGRAGAADAPLMVGLTEMMRTLAAATPMALATAPRNASPNAGDWASASDTPSILWSLTVMMVVDSAGGKVGAADVAALGAYEGLAEVGEAEEGSTLGACTLAGGSEGASVGAAVGFLDGQVGRPDGWHEGCVLGKLLGEEGLAVGCTEGCLLGAHVG